MNIKKIILGVVILLIVFAGIVFIVLNQAGKTKNNQPSYSVEGLHVMEPRVMEQVTSPIKISGKVDGGGWAGFEGQVGNVKLIDPNGNVLAEASLTATTEWTNKEVFFATELSFDSPFKGPAIIFFYNENPSGQKENDKEVGWPVFIR